MMRRKTVWFLTICGVLLLLVYLYSFSGLVFATVGANLDGDKLAQLRSEVAELEARYLELSGKITLAAAYELGFSDASGKTAFVAAVNQPRTLTQRPN